MNSEMYLGCTVAVNDAYKKYSEYYTHFTKLPINTTRITFSVKLWHPDQWQDSVLRILLTILPVPGTWEQHREWNTGIEILISTYKSGVEPWQGKVFKNVLLMFSLVQRN